MEVLYSWLGFIVFWIVVSLGVLALAFFAINLLPFFDTIFGYRIVKDKEYSELYWIQVRASEASRWLGSFTDLEPVWDYIFNGEVKVDEMRKEFADLRGTNVYNQPKE